MKIEDAYSSQDVNSIAYVDDSTYLYGKSKIISDSQGIVRDQVTETPKSRKPVHFLGTPVSKNLQEQVNVQSLPTTEILKVEASTRPSAARKEVH